MDTYVNNAATRAYNKYNVPAHQAKDPSQVRIKVSLSNQALYVVENNRVLLATAITPGEKKTPTPKGNFTVRKQIQQYRANTHGWAYNDDTGEFRRCKRNAVPKGWDFAATPMPYWTEFKDAAYGIHTGYVYSYPKSHGCIRVHHNVMPKIFALTRVGTPIHIADSQPEDYTAGKNLKRPADPSLVPENPILETSHKVFTTHTPVSFES